MFKLRNFGNIFLEQYFDKSLFQIAQWLILLWIAPSCMDDDAIRDFDRLKTTQSSGVFVVCEGNFMYSNASLSFYRPDSQMVWQDVFFNTNSLPLGDVAQSMNMYQQKAYIVVNNSGKIYIIDPKTFQYLGKITNLNSPRYVEFINDRKAYVSDLYDEALHIVDPKNQLKTGRIDCSNSGTLSAQRHPEQMISYQNLLFTNCWSYGNEILVFNTQTDQLIDSIVVGIQPQSMVVDQSGMLWVLCDGGFSGSSFGHEPGSLWKINLQSREIVSHWYFGTDELSPRHLRINPSSDSLYFLLQSWQGTHAQSGLYAMNLSAESLPTQAVIREQQAKFYSLGIDPNNGHIYIGNAKDYSSAGEIYRFDANFQAIDSFASGINPGYFFFNTEVQ